MMKHQSQGNTVRRSTLAARVCIGFVRIYQATLSQLIGGHCRYQPTCSHYAVEALETHGAIKGSWLTLRRLCRCHPLGGAGYDPVPLTGQSPGDSVKEEPDT